MLATAFRGLGAGATTNHEGPSGLPPPGMHIKITAVIICGMLMNELHWIGWWVLVTLSGNS